MIQERTYPAREQVRVEWTWIHYLVLTTSSIIIPCASLKFIDFNQPYKYKLFSVLGLFIDIIGVTLATLKTPYYGSFHDGGELEVWRRQEEDKWFKIGMFLIAIGAFLQTFGNIFQ